MDESIENKLKGRKNRKQTSIKSIKRLCFGFLFRLCKSNKEYFY